MSLLQPASAQLLLLLRQTGSYPDPLSELIEAEDGELMFSEDNESLETET